MSSPAFFINVFYLILFCIHVCVDDDTEKKGLKVFGLCRNELQVSEKFEIHRTTVYCQGKIC